MSVHPPLLRENLCARDMQSSSAPFIVDFGNSMYHKSSDMYTHGWIIMYEVSGIIDFLFQVFGSCLGARFALHAFTRSSFSGLRV